MHAAKKILPIFILILLIYIWFFAFHRQAQPNKKQVLGTNTNITLYIEPNDGGKPILDAINAAQKEILMEVYLLSDKDVISALENARTKGVAVNVILEAHPFGGGNLNPKTKDELASYGIAISWSNPKFALTHEKGIVIDDTKAFILSQNLTAAAFTKNREFDILDENPVDVTEIRNIFLADWNRSKFIPTDTSLLESPDNSRSVLTSLINSAQKEIDIEVEDIDDVEIIESLTEKAKTIPVSIILPTLKQINSNITAISKLESGNVKVKTMTAPYVHGKTILVDGKKAYVGSVNFSSQSLDSNRELGIIISEANAIEKIHETFTLDWNNASNVK